MKKLQSCGFCLMFMLFFVQANGQSQSLEKPWIGRTYVVQQYGVQNHNFVRQADIALRKFDFEGAFFALENAVAQNPNSPEVLMRRAVFRKTFGMEREARQDLALVNRQNPYLADLYGYNGPEGLWALLDETFDPGALQLNQVDVLDDYYRLWDIRYSERGINKGEMEGLDRALRKVEELDFDAALTELDQLLKAFPTSGLAYDLKGMIYTRQGQLEEAGKALATAVIHAPEFAIAWYNYGRVEELKDNLEQANVYYDRAVQLQEDLIQAQFDRAGVLRKKGGYEEALADYSSILQRSEGQHTAALLQRGVTKRQLGDFGGALVDYNQAIAAHPDQAELLQSRGNLNLVFGFYHHAIRDYTEALQLTPDDPSSLYNRGLAHFLIFDPVSACVDLQNSADLGHERAALKYTYFCGE
ncbi:MAG: tetratricopeptide repeat protein [Saprospiraceae bacterium]|nr:tetratricopeptide repeat protein [Saprospiraceae bacterium]